MKCAVIFFHSNIDKIYKPEWIEECVQSIKDQTLLDFDVFELNYGDGDKFYAQKVRGNYISLSRKFSNHIEAMNYLFSMLFANGYDVVFNTNMDDIYRPHRFEVQLKKIYIGYGVVSSNFAYIDDAGKPIKYFTFHNKNIDEEINSGHNIIAHPCVAMHKSAWDLGIRYNEEALGHEDLELWTKLLYAGVKFHISPLFLLYYRIHGNQITKKYRK